MTLAWAFADATLFVIVPDVMLTAMSLRGYRAGLHAVIYALGGTVFGCMVMWHMGGQYLTDMAGLLDYLPGISHAMMHRAAGDMERYREAAVYYGAVNGTPLKVYAAMAGGSVGLVERPAMLLAGFAIRLPRFLLLTLVTAALAGTVGRTWSGKQKLAALAGVWSVFYVGYFGYYTYVEFMAP